MSAEFVSGYYRDAKLVWHFGMTGGANDSHVGDGAFITIPDAIGRVGLPTVDTQPLYVKCGDEFIEVQSWQAVQGVGTADVFGVHGKDRYTVKNFSDFFLMGHRALQELGMDENCVEAVNLLCDGRVASMTLAFPQYTTEMPDGRGNVLPFLNFVTSHDSTFANDIRESNILQVCWNTTSASYRTKSAGARQGRVRHLPNQDRELQKVISHVMAIPERLQDTVGLANTLMGVKLTREAIQSVLDRIIPVDVMKGDGSNKKAITMATNRQWDILSLLQSKPDLQDHTDNAWGLYNALTDYNDHSARFNNSKNGTADENRFIRTILKGDTLADDALPVLLELAGPSRVIR